MNGRFRKQADVASGAFRQAVWLDFDHDYDLDLVLIGDESKLMRNNGPAGFSDETKRFPFVTGHALSAVRFDLEPDTPGFDLVVSYRDGPGVLYRDRLGGAYEAVNIDALPAGSTGLEAYDSNHDGRTDLAAQPGLLLMNRNGAFQAATGTLPSGQIAAADFDGKGRLGRAHIAQDGSLVLEHDTSAAYGNWIEVALTGVKNLKTAVGAKVEVKAGTRYEKQTYEGLPLVFRLGGQKEVETVRITWPNGLIQNELNQPVNKLAAIKEAQRLSGSCPMIFTWDGSRFQFITDVLGVAPLGASSGDGRFFPVDHDEYVSIPGPLLQEHDGDYEVRVTEELHEVSYLDQIRLRALDHPADTEIVTNEKFKSPPFPEFRLFGVKQRVYPLVQAGHGAAREVPARHVGRCRDAPPGSGFRPCGGIEPRGTGSARLGGLGRREHVPRRHPGTSRPDLPVPAGEGCSRQLEDRGGRHGDSIGQAEDHGGGPERQVSLRVARGADRDQPVRLLGRCLPGGERRAARGAADALRP